VLQDAISAFGPGAAAAKGAAAVVQGVTATSGELGTAQGNGANSGSIYTVPPSLPQPTTISGYAEIIVYAINVSSSGTVTFDQMFDKTLGREVYALAPPPASPQQQGQPQPGNPTVTPEPTAAQGAATTFFQNAIGEDSNWKTIINSTKVKVTLEPTQLTINVPTLALIPGHTLTQDESSNLVGFLTGLGDKYINNNLGNAVKLTMNVPPAGSVCPAASAPAAQPSR